MLDRWELRTYIVIIVMSLSLLFQMKNLSAMSEVNA